MENHQKSPKKRNDLMAHKLWVSTVHILQKSIFRIYEATSKIFFALDRFKQNRGLETEKLIYFLVIILVELFKNTNFDLTDIYI